MVFDPEARKAYDKNRYAKLKSEYMAKNPNYKSAREQQKEKRETVKLNGRQTQQLTGGFGSLMPVYEQPKQPKPRYNPNSIEAKKSSEHYAEDEDVIIKPKPLNVVFY
jgi:hypothetical protein